MGPVQGIAGICVRPSSPRALLSSMGRVTDVAAQTPELQGWELVSSGPIPWSSMRHVSPWQGSPAAGARPRWMQIRSQKPLQTALLSRARHPFCLIGGIFLFHFPYPWS